GNTSGQPWINILTAAGQPAINIQTAVPGNGAPYYQALGTRNDSNTSNAFSGGMLLAKWRTDAAMGANSYIGQLRFGGADDYTSGVVRATAGVFGYSGAAWSVGNAPTGIRFMVGSMPALPNAQTLPDTTALDLQYTGDAIFAKSVKFGTALY